MNNHQATLITVGDELLIGQVIDTNSAWLAQQLNDIGIWIKQRWSVGDNAPDIITALERAMAESSVIIITGGLGPTNDDITKNVLNDYFGGELVMNEQVLAHIEQLLLKRNAQPLLERNRAQAMVPNVATVLWNAVGTAPGMLFEKSGKWILSLPGVPHEMQYIMQHEMLEKIKKHFQLPSIQHKTLLTASIGESALAEHIQHWEAALPDFLKLAYLPNQGMVRLRITGQHANAVELSKALETSFEDLKQLVQQWLITDEDKPIHLVLGSLLNELQLSIGSVESCTGGYIAHLLSKEPGSSTSYMGSIITYSNEIKTKMADVSEKTLQDFGAVSEETIREMVAGGLKHLKTDLVIATSGIMGPTGNTPNKPIGTVWMGVGNRNRIKTKLIHARWDREKNIIYTAHQALLLAIKFIRETKNANDC